jgi:hypothetical protein
MYGLESWNNPAQGTVIARIPIKLLVAWNPHPSLGTVLLTAWLAVGFMAD